VVADLLEQFAQFQRLGLIGQFVEHAPARAFRFAK